MSFTHTISQSWTNGSGSVSKALPLTGSSETNVDVVVPDSTTNQLQAFALTTANMLSYFILSNVDCTLKTNSTGSPANTISLKAGVPLTWSTSVSYFSNVFTTNVTAMYFTNASGQQARINLRFLSP